ncbi:MAG: hypothetical protein V7776_19160 [Halopseudomonas aestusnigri]
MNFKYNPDTFTIESDDPSVFVKVAGKVTRRGTYFILHEDDKRIGFATNHNFNFEQTEVQPDGTIIWRISEIGCGIYHLFEFLGNGIDEEIEPYRFTDEAEQSHLLELFKNALTAYPGTPDLSKEGEVPIYSGNNLPATVEYSEGVHLCVDRGAYLKQEIPFKFNPEKLKVTSNDPTLYLQYVGSLRDMGTHFVMHMDGKKIGFATTDFHPEDKTEVLSDGTHIWRIDEVGCYVWENDCFNSKEIGPTHFSSKAEQTRFMETFAQALMNFSGRIISVAGRPPLDSPDPGVSLVEYTDKVLQKARCGNYLENGTK